MSEHIKNSKLTQGISGINTKIAKDAEVAHERHMQEVRLFAAACGACMNNGIFKKA